MSNIFPLVGDVEFDAVDGLTYDGAGNVLTAVYKLGGLGGNVVMRLTMTYDADGNLATVVKVYA